MPDESSAHRNYFNQELHGGPTTLPWALRIDPVHRPVDTPTIGLYHPTFLYVRPAAHRLRDPADAGEREKLAEFLDVDEESLDAKMVGDPDKAVEVDVAALRADPNLPNGMRSSGYVDDVERALPASCGTVSRSRSRSARWCPVMYW